MQSLEHFSNAEGYAAEGYAAEDIGSAGLGRETRWSGAAGEGAPRDADAGVDEGEDFFATQGCRDLCVALLTQAARDLAHGRDDPEAQATLAWMHGAESPVSFEMCLAVLGLEDSEEAVRKAMLADPHALAKSLAGVLQSGTWGQKSSVASVLEEEAQVISSYRTTMRG
jgi:hypothetical protein